MVDINNVVAGTISEFISYALWITAILVIYYFIRFVMGTEKKEEQDGEGLAKIKEWLTKRKETEKEAKDEKKKSHEEQQHAHQRKRLLGRGRSICARIINDCNEGRDYLQKRESSSLSRARSVVNSIGRDLKILKQLIAKAQSKLQGEKRTYLGEWYNFTEAMEELLQNSIHTHLPPNVNDIATWDRLIPSVRENFKELKIRAGLVMNALEGFVDEDKMGTPPAIGSVSAPPPPAPSAGPSGIPLRGGGTRGRVI